MRKRIAFQITFQISRKGFKTFPCAGIVLATTQVEALATANQTMSETIAQMDNGSTFKLYRISKLQSDFFLMVPNELEKEATVESR
jgi:hypothetical protein